VARYRQELDLKAVLAVKQVNTTIPIKAHINGYLFKHLCDVIFDGLLGVVYPWFVIQATSINTQ
jgi:hypothetical protein